MIADPRILARSLFLSHHLAEFLLACAAANLDVIVLKGAALWETMYDIPGQRDFRDIDVLVRTADAVLARTVLETLGYSVDTVHWASLISEQDCQADFAKQTPGGPVIIELHTNLINNDLLWGSAAVDLEGLWRRAESVTLSGVSTRMLGPEDQILHLCLHLAGHYFDAPRSVLDISQVCRARNVDWELLTAIAKCTHATAIAWSALRLSNALVPKHVMDLLAPRLNWRRHWLERLTRAKQLNDRHRFLLLLLLLDNPLSVPRVLWRVLFPTRRWLLDHYAPGVDPTPTLRFLYASHVRFLLRL